MNIIGFNSHVKLIYISNNIKCFYNVTLSIKKFVYRLSFRFSTNLPLENCFMFKNVSVKICSMYC
jgi:hypothetical protein